MHLFTICTFPSLHLKCTDLHVCYAVHHRYSLLHGTPVLSKGSLQAPTAVIPHQPTGAFTVEAEGHLNILTGPAGRLCFLHSPHTGISPGISAQGGLSTRLSLSLLKRQKRRHFEFPILKINVFILPGLLRKMFWNKTCFKYI